MRRMGSLFTRERERKRKSESCFSTDSVFLGGCHLKDGVVDGKVIVISFHMTTNKRERGGDVPSLGSPLLGKGSLPWPSVRGWK
jgi:hypothetical protein